MLNNGAFQSVQHVVLNNNAQYVLFKNELCRLLPNIGVFQSDEQKYSIFI